jgi:hypothetical protein
MLKTGLFALLGELGTDHKLFRFRNRIEDFRNSTARSHTVRPRGSFLLEGFPSSEAALFAQSVLIRAPILGKRIHWIWRQTWATCQHTPHCWFVFEDLNRLGPINTAGDRLPHCSYRWRIVCAPFVTFHCPQLQFCSL